MHRFLDLTPQDAQILRRLALRPYTDKAFGIARTMQDGDVVDAQIMAFCTDSAAEYPPAERIECDHYARDPDYTS